MYFAISSCGTYRTSIFLSLGKTRKLFTIGAALVRHKSFILAKETVQLDGLAALELIQL